jgi:hypothetical protein
MNSADVHKPMKGDSGMEGYKHDIALGFKSLTPGERKERFSYHANSSDPEVQHRLDSTTEFRGEKAVMDQRMRSPSLDRWEVMG